MTALNPISIPLGKGEPPSAPREEPPLAGGSLAALGAPAPGLVSSQTSDPREFQTDTERMVGKNASVQFMDPAIQRAGRCRKNILNAARLLTKGFQNQRVGHRVCFLTLTYARVNDWNPRDISAFCHTVRQYLKRRGIPLIGLWKLEMQKRGAVHYHLLVWLPKGITLPKPDKQGWWKHGSTQRVWAKNPYGYVAKYLSKEEVGMVPKGAHLYGLLGLDAVYRQEIRWWNSPRWIRDLWGIEHDPIRVPGGYWMSRLTGELKRGEWHFGGLMWMDGRRYVRMIKSPHIERGEQDQAGAIAKAREAEFWESAGRALQFETDRFGWLRQVEAITGEWQ